MNFEHDKGYKFFLNNPSVFAGFVKSFVNERWALELDETKLSRIDKSYIGPDFTEKESDIVYKACIKDTEVIFYVLLELQSTVDYTMPFRLLVYMSHIWMDVIKNAGENVDLNRKSFKLPAIIPIVLYNGKTTWNAAKSLREIIHGKEYFGDYLADFKYIIFEVNKYSLEELIKINSIMSDVFMIDQNVPWTEILSRLRELRKTLKGRDKEELILFRTWLKYIIRQRAPEKSATEIERIIEEIKEVDEMMLNITQKLDEAFREYERRGIEKQKIETAVKMLKKGIDIDTIIDITELSKEKIEEIKKGMTN